MAFSCGAVSLHPLQVVQRSELYIFAERYLSLGTRLTQSFSAGRIVAAHAVRCFSALLYLRRNGSVSPTSSHKQRTLSELYGNLLHGTHSLCEFLSDAIRERKGIFSVMPCKHSVAIRCPEATYKHTYPRSEATAGGKLRHVWSPTGRYNKRKRDWGMKRTVISILKVSETHKRGGDTVHFRGDWWQSRKRD